MSAVGGFLDRLARDLQAITDPPTTAVVEGIAYTLEQLPADRYLSLVMEPGRASAFAAGVTSETAISFGRMILERFTIDWDAAGFSGRRLDELVEFMLRTVQSFILDPGGPDRHGKKELRAFLHRWVAPAVEQQSAKRSGGRSAPPDLFLRKLTELTSGWAGSAESPRPEPCRRPRRSPAEPG